MADEELTDIMVDMEFGELMKDWIEDWSDDENLDREDRSENGNEWDDLNIDELDDDQENNSELSNEDYISQFISECHNAYDYYGESDAETGLNDESLDAPDSGESESSVIMSEVTQDDGAKNMQDTASADDKRDMFMQIMEMTFTSHDAAYDFYNSYARDNGFNIRKNKVRYSKTESRHMRYRRFVCSRQGKRDSKLLNEEGHSRRLRAETRCFCEAHLTVKLDQKRGVWYVQSFEDKHSHMLAGPDEDDLRKIDGMEIVEIKLGDGSQQYIVAWKNNRKRRFWVEYTPENLLKQTNDISKCAVEYVDDGEGNMIEVKDPMKVSSKGATKADESRPVSKNGRPLSFDELKTRCRKVEKEQE
ncbi:uncharacterized protein LOC119271684 [Triticum dicoccoides]|uniref:uncharacterized protein LOC119271684 n=1 Tax=Triticum dicoccoides TaxID=85692 RepID=UPI0018909EAE|nr:uncharacterized protein LOC119271684 [Triticum dicoccoides]